MRLQFYLLINLRIERVIGNKFVQFLHKIKNCQPNFFSKLLIQKEKNLANIITANNIYKRNYILPTGKKKKGEANIQHTQAPHLTDMGSFLPHPIFFNHSLGTCSKIQRKTPK
jgi:hypothetical protein